MRITYLKSNVPVRELTVTEKIKDFSEVGETYGPVPRVGDTVRFRYKEELIEMEVKKVVWQIPCKLTQHETFFNYSGDISPKLREMVYVYGE